MLHIPLLARTDFAGPPLKPRLSMVRNAIRRPAA